MQSRRDRIRQVFQGCIVDPPPVSMRLDIWHTHAASTGALPDGIRGLAVEQVEDYLGFCRSARYRAHVGLEYPEEWTSVEESGDTVTTSYRLPGRALTRVFRHTDEEKRAGMGGQTVKYPIEGEADCKALLDALDRIALRGNFDGFDDFDRLTGDAGLPMLIVGESPVDSVMLNLMGYETFFYALADYPETVDELISALESRYRRDIWPKALGSNAEIILRGSHFSDATTPPPLFRKYHLPYLRDFNSLAHHAGKKVLWHADAAMGLLLGDVLDAGFDGADCLATAPLVPQRIEEYYDAWQGRMVCWGGLPGTIFQPEYAADEFRAHVESLREFTRGKPGFIIGASDNVMPGALWDRILFVRDVFSVPSPWGEG